MMASTLDQSPDARDAAEIAAALMKSPDEHANDHAFMVTGIGDKQGTYVETENERLRAYLDQLEELDN